MFHFCFYVGFCTPGIIVAIYSLLANNPTTEYIEEHLDGNLCRCTGYRPIWDAARSLCTDSDQIIGPCGTPCSECPARDSCEMDCNIESKAKEKIELETSLCCSSSSDKILNYASKEFQKDWLQIPNEMFPRELKSPPTKPLIIVDRTYQKAGTWIKPTTLEGLLELLSTFRGKCKIVVGNTEVGIEQKFKHSVYPRLISPSTSIESLFSISATSSRLRFGSCASLSQIQYECEKLATGLSPDLARIAKPIYDMLRWFASTQIRNVACLGGNLATASPISDMNPLLACMNAELEIVSFNQGDAIGDNVLSNGSTVDSKIERRIARVSDFFLGYRQVDLRPHELIESISVPRPKPVFEYVFPFKQAKRREDDISIVTSGMRIVVKPYDNEIFSIEDISLAFGGMAPQTIRAKQTEKFLIKKPFSRDTFEAARSVLLEELILPDDVPGGQPHFRKTLACSFLHKLFLMTSNAINEDLEAIKHHPHFYPSLAGGIIPPSPQVDMRELSASESFILKKKPSIVGTQKYPLPKVTIGLEGDRLSNLSKSVGSAEKSVDSVGQAVSHSSGPSHCTGEALYTDDIPTPHNILHASLILATTCNAMLLSVDTTDALNIPGVVAIYSHEDVNKLGGDNTLGFAPIGHDEYIFLPKGERVAFVGQVIGICVAETLEASEAGVRSVRVSYGEVKSKTIVSIEDAIEAGSMYDFAKHSMEKSGQVDISEDDMVVKVSGSFRCGGQEHFYLETNSSLVIPSESATDLTVYTSTQAVNKTQMFCAAATNTPAARVVVRMKRMGGGFGGKGKLLLSP